MLKILFLAADTDILHVLYTNPYTVLQEDIILRTDSENFDSFYPYPAQSPHKPQAVGTG